VTFDLAALGWRRAFGSKGGVMSEPVVTSGDVGGIFAGLVAVMIAIGQGAKWLLKFREGQAATRAKKLQIWHDELKTREEKLEKWQGDLQALQLEHHKSMEERLRIVVGQNRALRMAFELVAARVRDQDPHNADLVQAEQLLRAAFPLDPALSPDFDILLGRVDLAAKPRD
jgi:hypothetical protein